jgi:hypothetical protein
MAKSSSTVRRVTASLRERDESNLERVAETAGLSQNDAIRKALATEAFVQETLDAGGEILVRDSAGNIKVVQFVS